MAMNEMDSRSSLFNLFGCISNQLNVLHCAALLNSLQQQRQSGILCDFTIHIKNGGKRKNFLVHKCILSALSRTISKTDSTVTGMVLKTSEIVVERFVNFVYTGNIIAMQAMSAEEILQIWKVGSCLDVEAILLYLARERPDVKFNEETEGTSVSENMEVIEIRGELYSDKSIIEDSHKKIKSEPRVHEVVENESAFPVCRIPDKTNPQTMSDIPLIMECESDEDYAATLNREPPLKKCNVKRKNPKSNGRNSVPRIKPITIIENRKSSFEKTKVISSSSSTSHVHSKTQESRQKHKKFDKKNSTKQSQQVTNTEQSPNLKSIVPASKSLEQYEPEDIDLLRELKQLAPNACIWNVMPDLM